MDGPPLWATLSQSPKHRGNLRPRFLHLKVDPMMEIQFREDDIERFREPLRKISDTELIAMGKRVRYLANPKTQHRKLNSAFVEQLKEARLRHPGAVFRLSLLFLSH
jgi:hypothetical protein